MFKHAAIVILHEKRCRQSQRNDGDADGAADLVRSHVANFAHSFRRRQRPFRNDKSKELSFLPVAVRYADAQLSLQKSSPSAISLPQYWQRVFMMKPSLPQQMALPPCYCSL